MRQILIVEDEAVVALDIEERLEMLGFSVCGRVSSAQEAIQAVVNWQPDLVLMDIILEGPTDGIEAAKIIRDTYAIPVVFLTAHGDQATLDRAKVTQPYGYIIKPFSEVDLRTTLELALYRYQTETEQDKQEPKEAVAQFEFGQRILTKGLRDPERALAVLERVEPFHGLTQNLLREIAQYVTFQKLQASELVAFEGEDSVPGFVVLSGRLAMVKTSVSGKDLVVELIPPGDPFGLIAALDGRSCSAMLRVPVATELLWVSRRIVFEVLKCNTKMSEAVIRMVFERLRGAHDLSRALAHDPVEVRVASALAALIPRFCSLKQDKEEDHHSVQMTRQELTDIIGSTSETVIRTTRAMEKEEILDLSRSGIIKIISPEKLNAIAQRGY